MVKRGGIGELVKSLAIEEEIETIQIVHTLVALTALVAVLAESDIVDMVFTGFLGCSWYLSC
jgi:hypothetical protein